VLAHGFLGHAEPAGALGIGVPGGDQAQQLPLPGGELGRWVAAAFGVQEGLVQVRAQQHQQRPVAFGEVGAGPAPQDQPQGAPVPGGQAQQHLAVKPLGPDIFAVHAGAVPLPHRVEVR